MGGRQGGRADRQVRWAGAGGGEVSLRRSLRLLTVSTLLKQFVASCMRLDVDTYSRPEQNDTAARPPGTQDEETSVSG